jgi:hypothetical protein
MKKVKWIMIPCFLVFLSSCAAPIVKYQTFNPAYSWMQEPAIGKPVKAGVGQIMAVESLVAVFDGFISRERYEIDIPDDVNLFPQNISPEDEYIIWGCLPNGDVIIRNMAFARAAMYVQGPSKLELALIARENGEVYGYAPFAPDQLTIKKMDRAIKLVPQKISVAGSFRQDLVYQGKSRDVIKLGSLEYLGDMAEPVSQQDLAYNLAVSKTIECQGMVMNVLEATESAITFVVSRYMMKP